MTKVLAFGAFVELDQEIQGLAHIGELADPTPKEVSDVLKVGDVKEFKIINIEPEEHRLGLSLKAMNESLDKPVKAKPDSEAEAPAAKEPQKPVEARLHSEAEASAPPGGSEGERSENLSAQASLTTAEPEKPKAEEAVETPSTEPEKQDS